ncbi:MAG: hypothetical protein IT426_12525 [Pirellulales bacterium]|nr:hypothetical protein [Pirellulales bacterium]
MPMQYLVPCSCGRKTRVEIRQAGEAISCECGLKLEIPRLLELKKLETVAISSGDQKKPAVWGMGHGLLLTGIVILASVAVLGVFVLKFGHDNPYSRMTPDQIRAQFQKMSPVETWETWMYFKQVGINPRKERIDRHLEGLHEVSNMHLIFLGIAAGGGFALVVAGIIIAYRKRPARATLDPN